MKKQFKYRKIFLSAVLFIIALNSSAQQRFTHTATKTNNSCNGDCTWLDIPELNNNPSAILFVTPELVDGINLNPHPIGVFYFQKKWNIFNLDQRVIPENARFNVVYFTRPDSAHFLYTIKQEDIQSDGAALINHPALNGNPGAQVQFLNSWGYEAGIPVPNRDEVNFHYNAAAGKWAIANINKKSLFAQVAYNITVSSGDNATMNPDSNGRSSASYKQIEIKELQIRATVATQQEYIHTATKANNSCNGDCTWLDRPELNDNPFAIIFATPELVDGINLNPHRIGVYYFQNKWNIFNLDQRVIPENARFNVVYFTRPDPHHFLYTIKQEDIQRDGAVLINHPALNGNPGAQVRFINSWGYEEGVPVSNRDEVNFQYNTAAGKWTIANINKKSLFAQVAYNIMVFNEENPLPGQGKDDPILSKLDPKTYTKSVDTIPAVPVKGDPINVIKTPKTIIKTADILPIVNRPIDKNDIETKKTIPPSYDFSKIQICIEKEAITNLPPKTSVAPYPVIPKIKPNGDIEPVSTITQPLSAVTNRMWTTGEEISVGFLVGQTLRVTGKIMNYVKEWETYANIKFVFINDVKQAKIKIGFENDGTSWSWLGREVLRNPSGLMTMNFGWLNDKTDETEFRSVVLHEFGHALGFIHEHQSPNAGIPWDKEKVYSLLGGPPNNWSREKVDFNVFNKYSTTTTNSSTYDIHSIMHYFFPSELTTDGSSFAKNTNLSIVDKTFAVRVYPFPPAPPVATGVLRTGDDCDEIEFTVEYNVVHNSEVEFILQPGYDHHNALVNWWKMISIQQISGVVTGLELYNTKKIPISMIDKTRAITFAKAKTLGVHTGLPYTWNPWPAIIGGCRVKLVWRRDSCN